VVCPLWSPAVVKKGAHGGNLVSPVLNAEELELKAKLEGEMPIEQDLSRWFALYGAPL
jgi:hypothetical protein